MEVHKITDKNAAQTIQENDIALIECWAPWCGPCKQMASTIDELAKQYHKKVLVGKLNIDENQDFPFQHQIKSIPTTLIFKKGKKVGQIVGVQTLQELAAKLDEHINQQL